MVVEVKAGVEKVGETLGFLLSYFIFTTILFFILFLLKKIPESWSYFHIMGITLTIIFLGKVLRWWLK